MDFAVMSHAVMNNAVMSYVVISYPVWEPFISNGLLIAIVAILHVFVSHFAIGGGLYLVVAETIARKKNDLAQLAYLKRHSRFFILITLVFGVVSGVGIWITIGLIQPLGTSVLIRTYVWGWATEWVTFFVEIAAALFYYYGWQRLSPKVHLAVGWIYFIASWLSLVVINGILTFMLTPGKWLETGLFWDGFFNVSYIPSTIFRTFICIMLAGLYAAFTLAGEKDIKLKSRLLRQNGTMTLVAILLAIPFGYWYLNSLPASVTAGLLPDSIPMLAQQVMIFSTALLFILTFLGTIAFPKKAGYISGMILLLCGLCAFGGFEWEREALRKPFIIKDYLYSTGLTVAQIDQRDGSEPMKIAYSTGDRGRDLYLSACRPCHTISGYNSLDDRLAGMETEHIANIIPLTAHFIAPMPPWAGNDDDAMELARYLKGLSNPDPLTIGASLSEAANQKIVFDRRCGGCHTLSDPDRRPIGETFTGLEEDEAAEIIMELPDLAEEMPPFIGDEKELKLLINHLTKGGSDD